MYCDFSSIRQLLSNNYGASLHRQIFVLAGENVWQTESLQNILQGYENDSLWVGEQACEIIPCTYTNTKKARNWLGNEKRVVVFDADSDFDPDSFAAITGIVVGGGLFFLLLPAVEKWNEVYHSNFGQRLIKSINETDDIVVIEQSNNEFKFSPENLEQKSSKKHIPPYLTTDQKYAVENIEEHVLHTNNKPIVLVSDRGRGKSAALGIVAAKLLKAGIKHIAITAPRLHATDVIFKHISEILPDAIITRGKVAYHESIIQFYSPDQLTQENVDTKLLLIDEAAAIPVPILTSFLNEYSQCVFATTVHGYEGTGRGFALRFYKVLDKNYPDWLKLNMETPIRWKENDPLEKWMFKLLCLDAEIADITPLKKINLDEFENSLLVKDELFSDPILLNEVFSLLVLAHYRTRPNDLKKLLDEDDLSLYATLYKKHVVAVALVIREGGFTNSLSTLVYRGERRPQGHLLAQALTYHCGVEHAATLDYARIMRIAVHPNLQQLGIGTSLLEFIINNEKIIGRDAIGTSFGMNEKLFRFWDKLNFNIVRIGFTREKTSGENAGIMLLPLNDKGNRVYQEAYARFKSKVSFWFDDVLKNIPIEIKNIFHSETNIQLELTKYDEDDLDSFIHYSRNYELCIASLNKLVLLNENKIIQDNFPDDFREILNEKVNNKLSWKELGKNMGLTGQNEARDVFHDAIIYLMK